MASGSAIAAGAQVFDLEGITNPSVLGSFYARIYTYSTATFGTYAGPDVVATPPGAGVHFIASGI